MSTQFHPEAKGGPLDSSFLFDAYLGQVNEFNKGRMGEGRPSPLLVDILSKQRVGVAPGHVLRETERRAGLAKEGLAKEGVATAA